MKSWKKTLHPLFQVSQPLASIRLFDAPDGTEPRVTFFRDHAAWCPYCHKVWLTLEEKRIPYRVEKVPMSCYGKKPAEFNRMQVCVGVLCVDTTA